MPPSSEHLEMLAELMDAPALQRNVWGAPADRSNYRGRRMTRGSKRRGPSAENQRELNPRPLIAAGASRYTIFLPVA